MEKLTGFFKLFEDLVSEPSIPAEKKEVLKTRLSKRSENRLDVRWPETHMKLDVVMEAYRNFPLLVSDDNVQKIFLKVDKIQQHFVDGFTGRTWFFMYFQI